MELLYSFSILALTSRSILAIIDEFFPYLWWGAPKQKVEEWKTIIKIIHISKIIKEVPSFCYWGFYLLNCIKIILVF